MLSGSPLVSVLMPSFDQAHFLGAALDSVLQQDHPRLELLVADGGSTDGSVALLRERAARDARLRWWSAPDQGPADAVNRALQRARGTVIGWLNSDDLYLPGAVSRAVAAFQAQPDWLLVYGHGEHVDAQGVPLGRYPTRLPGTALAQFAEGCFICQPTVFFKRTLPLLLGGLDPSLRTAFDFDYWLRAFRQVPGRIGFVDALQAQSRLHPGGITARLRRTVILEGMQVLARHLGAAPKEWLLTYVDELLALPADQRGVADLRAHLSDTVAEALPWLAPADLTELQQQLQMKLKPAEP